MTLARHLAARHRDIHAQLGGTPDLVGLARIMRDSWTQVAWRNAAASAGLDGPVSTAMQCVTVMELEKAGGVDDVDVARAGIARARSALGGVS